MRHESIAPKIEGCSELFSHLTTISPSVINNQAGLRMARAVRASRKPSSEHVAREYCELRRLFVRRVTDKPI
jgi:hypothetical protein